MITPADFEASIAAVREKIAPLKERTDGLENGQRLPRAQAIQSFDAWFQAHVAAGERLVSVAGNFACGNAPRTVLGAIVTGDQVFDVMCWNAPEQMRDRLVSQFDAVYADGDEGMDPAKRAAELKKVRAQLFKVEVDEERLIMQAEQAGFRIPRRGDADPAAIFEA